jgi:FMN phosphatase YigB (HAD superfamily)
MQHARWLFFDLGNTLISEEAATECRLQQLVGSLKRYGKRYSVEDVRSALAEASREFAPRLITRAIEKLTDDPECRKLIEAEARYPKELESPYEGAEQTLRVLSSRYLIGVIAESVRRHKGTVGDVGVNALHLDLPLFHGGGPRKTGPDDLQPRSFAGWLYRVASSDDR